MSTHACKTDTCSEKHEIEQSDLGTTIECDCGTIYRIARTREGAVELELHPSNALDE